MKKVIVITRASSGFDRLSANALAKAGHTPLNFSCAREHGIVGGNGKPEVRPLGWQIAPDKLLRFEFLCPNSATSGEFCHSLAIERRRKEPDSPWFQSWQPSPRRGYGWGSETNGARLQKRPRPRWSLAVPHRHRVPP